MERHVLIREKRSEGNVMLRAQILAELPDGMVRVKLEDKGPPRIMAIGSPRTSIREVKKEDVLPGSRYFGQPVAGVRPSIISRQYSSNVNSLSNLLLEKGDK